MPIQTCNPATGKVIHDYPEMSNTEVNAIIHQCQQAFLAWRDLTLEKRSHCLRKAGDMLLARRDEYATLISTEMGKPIQAARAEIEKCAKTCMYFAQQATVMLEPRSITTEMQKSYIAYEPTGIIFAIMPWNFPFWQVFRFACANLMGGNACLLKHAPIVTGCALAIEALLREAGFPEHLFRCLIIDQTQAEPVIAHPLIQGVTLTGSQRAGKSVAAIAGSHLKKVVLELGGSDPYLILANANLKKAAQICVRSRLANTGQVCIAAKRLIIVEAVKHEFKQLVLAELQNYTLGNPLDEQVSMGPMARADLRETLDQQVHASARKGAVILTGGEIPSGAGYYYPITVLDNVHKGMPAYDEELFGPVLVFIDAKDEEEAISIANDTPYGLAAAVFTEDLIHGENIARKKINVGTCYVNQQVSSDPRLPFGGVKLSGFGRELGEVGMHEFLNIKTIGVVKH